MNQSRKPSLSRWGAVAHVVIPDIGVIQALEERGYDIVKISGCSMGAIVGGFMLAGKLPQYRDWVT